MIKSFFKQLLPKKQNPPCELSLLQQQLISVVGFVPINEAYYQLSLLHKSAFVKDEQGQQLNNERLEFLGDALLGAIISELLYQRFPTQNEGFMTMMRSKIVKRENLDDLAKKIGLPELVLGHKSNNNRHIFGNALEALVGAIYLDRGYDVCKGFVENQLVARYVNLERLAKTEENFKSKLIEWGQKQHKVIRFEMIAEDPQAGNLIKFHSKVYVDDIELGLGVGFAKRKAEQNASKQALRKLNIV
ncbi:MAG TPA: ribonuclease III [Paludibacteraceae bacterium]|nr:ribonuclease III [Paludibacteraceae bacterium]